MPEPAARRVAAEQALGVDAETSLPAARGPSHGFVYLEAQGRSGRRPSSLRSASSPASASNRRSGALSARRRRRAGARVRRVDNQGLAGIELSSTTRCAAGPGSETIVRDPFGRVVDVVERDGRAAGPGRLPHARPPIQAKAETCCGRRSRQWGAKAATASCSTRARATILAMATAPAFDANRFAERAGTRSATAP